MAYSFRQIKNRLRSIENTRKITSAMELISISKLNRIGKMFYNFRPYCRALESLVLGLVSSQGSPETHPFFDRRQPVTKRLLCLVTSDNGLCGSYNNIVIRSAEDFINKQGWNTIELVIIGRRGIKHFRDKKLGILHTYAGLNGWYDDVVADNIVNILINCFVSGRADEVYLAYMHFETAVVQKPLIEKLLGIETQQDSGQEYILEPGCDELLVRVLPAYIRAKVKLALLEAFTCEHSARGLAMKKSSDNAEELLSGLSLLANKVRQAGITQDMLEIISSAEALKG